MKNFISGFSLFILIVSSSLVYAETKVCFSPNGGCQEIVISEICKVHHSIDIAMYSFTSREIAQALVDAKRRGIKVRVVLDNSQIKEDYSKSRYLINKGLDVKFHLGPGLMHDKFAVIDGREVITGSFNWTNTAEKKNDENLLVITEKGLAGQYAKQFKQLWSQSGEGQLKEF